MELFSLKRHLFSKNNILLALGLVSMLGITIFIGYLSIFRLPVLTTQLDTTHKEYYQRKLTSNAMHGNILKRKLIQQKMLNVTDPVSLEDLRMSQVSLDQQFITHVAEIEKVANMSTEERSLFNHILDATEIVEPHTASVREMIVGNRVTEALELMQNKTIPAELDTLQIVSRLTEYYEETINNGYKNGLKEYDKTLRQLELLVWLLILAGLVAGLYILYKNAKSAAVIKLQKEKLRSRIDSQRNQIKDQEEHLAVTLRAIGDGVFSLDESGHIDYMNHAAEIICGMKTLDAAGSNICDVIKIEGYLNGDDRFLQLRNDTLQLNGIEPLHAKLLQPEGTTIEVERSMTDILDNDGTIKGYVLVIRDISERKKMQQELSFQASHDELTGIANRSEFNKKLQQSISRVKFFSEANVLCFLDLDRFKVVNDTCGHAAGDEILRQITQLFKSSLRKHDIIARVGGDEFTIILTDCSITNARKVMQLLVEKLKKHRFCWDKEIFALGVSIGMLELEAGMDEIKALSAADSACHLAKDSASQSIHVYMKNDTKVIMQQGELMWFSKVRQALDDDNFELFYQPIEKTDEYTAEGASPSHFEVLLRMKDGDGGYITPANFLPAAVRYGLMPYIDRWVIEKTLGWYSQHQQKLQGAIVAINIDGISLCDEEFLHFVEACFEQTGAPYSRVVFELTESSVISNMVAAKNFITTLKNKGCQFALDDFGTGVASFEYLKTLPIDYLKIDGSFVKEMLSDRIDEEVVRSINAIGQAMNKVTIAEFVEDDAIRRKLSCIGVDYVQGYGIARPRPISQLAA